VLSVVEAEVGVADAFRHVDPHAAVLPDTSPSKNHPVSDALGLRVKMYLLVMFSP
jgi:hypothetical protein